MAVLWCLFVYNEVIVKYKKDVRQAKRNGWASLITVAAVLFAFSQVYKGLIAVNHGWSPPGVGVQTAKQWFAVFNGGYQFKYFEVIHRQWSLIPNLDVIVILLAWVCVVVGVYQHIKQSGRNGWQMCAILVCGLAWQIYFACNIYGMNWQRIGLLYFVTVFVLWICYEKKNKKWTAMALIAFWILNTSSQAIMVKDISSATGGDALLAAQYDALITNDAPCYSPYLTGIQDLMTHKFTYARFDVHDTITSEAAVEAYTAKTGVCYVIMYEPLLVDHDKWHIETLVAPDSVVKGDYLYYIERK